MRLRSIALAAAVALASHKASAAPGLEGVWYGLRADGISGKVKVDHYTLLADGRIFRTYPSEGLGQPVDFAYECRYAECGTYERRGAQIAFRNQISGGLTELTLDAEGVLRGPASKISYRRMHLLAGPLDGTWGVFDPQGGPPPVEITFQPTGRFKESGLLNYVAWAAQGQDASGRTSRKPPPRGEGTYTIARGTLELRYDGGPVARFFLATPPAVPPGARPATLHLDGATLDRATAADDRLK